MTWLPTPSSSDPLLPSEHQDREIDTLSLKSLPLTKELFYKTSIATVCFNGTIFEKIDAVAGAGFDLIEIMTPDLDEASAEDIYDYCHERNLLISILQPFRDLEGFSDSAKFQSRLNEFEDLLKQTLALHTDTLLLCANCQEDVVDDDDLAVSQLRVAAKIAAKYNIKIAYENLSWATYNYLLERLVEIVLKVDEPNFGACIDLFHINIHNSPVSLVERLPGKVFFVQLCDSPILHGLGIMEHARNYRVFPFQGDYTNIMEVFDQVLKAGYKGYLSLEVFNKPYRERTGQCGIVADDALRSLVYLQAKYSDLERGTSYLPDLKLTGVSGLNCDLGSVSLQFASETDIDGFHLRAQVFGYSSFCASMKTSIGSEGKSNHIVEVPTRFLYNRYVMIMKYVLGLTAHHDQTNANNLPLQTSFGTENVSITLRVLEK